MRYLPVGSATWAAQADVPYGWSLTDLLLTDLFFVLSGEQHPSRPGAGKSDDGKADLFARLRAQRERLSKTTD